MIRSYATKVAQRSDDAQGLTCSTRLRIDLIFGNCIVTQEKGRLRYAAETPITPCPLLYDIRYDTQDAFPPPAFYPFMVVMSCNVYAKNLL